MIFDTGLHRHLTLTQSDEYLRKMRWGTGQPETVRAFLVEADAGQGFSPLVRVEDHWQRRWQFQPKEARSCRALWITVLATWGLDHARIVRVGAWKTTESWLSSRAAPKPSLKSGCLPADSFLHSIS